MPVVLPETGLWSSRVERAVGEEYWRMTVWGLPVLSRETEAYWVGGSTKAPILPCMPKW